MVEGWDLTVMIGAYERLGSPCFCIYLEVQSLVLIFNIFAV